MYSSYWMAADTWTSFRKGPFGNDRPDNLLDGSVLSRRQAMRANNMPNTTSNLALNELRKPHANGQFPVNPYSPPSSARGIPSSTLRPTQRSEASTLRSTPPPPQAREAITPQAPSHLRSITASPPSTRSTPPSLPARSPAAPSSSLTVAAPNSGNIGYCQLKSDRVRTLEAQAKAAYQGAAAASGVDGTHVVHSHSHLFRWKYPHTLGRMKAYARDRGELARRERYKPHRPSIHK